MANIMYEAHACILLVKHSTSSGLAKKGMDSRKALFRTVMGEWGEGTPGLNGDNWSRLLLKQDEINDQAKVDNTSD